MTHFRFFFAKNPTASTYILYLYYILPIMHFQSSNLQNWQPFFCSIIMAGCHQKTKGFATSHPNDNVPAASMSEPNVLQNGDAEYPLHEAVLQRRGHVRQRRGHVWMPLLVPAFGDLQSKEPSRQLAGKCSAPAKALEQATAAHRGGGRRG